MKKEYCIIKQDVSNDNAYYYNTDSYIPTEIECIRIYSGKHQKLSFNGNWNYNEIHNIVYYIKRGYTVKEIKEYIKSIK